MKRYAVALVVAVAVVVGPGVVVGDADNGFFSALMTSGVRRPRDRHHSWPASLVCAPVVHHDASG